MSIEPKVGEVWDTTWGLAVITHWSGFHDGWRGTIGAVDYCGRMEHLKRHVELREGQVWRDRHLNDWKVSRVDGQLAVHGVHDPYMHYCDLTPADLVRDGWTLVSEPEETDEALRKRIRYTRPSIASSHFVNDTKKGELATVSFGAMTTERLRAVAESFGFYDPKTGEWIVEWTNDQPIDMRPLAEAFAEVARCMQTPRGIIVLNRQWCDEQVANPPRWARDGRGVARGERFEAFKVGLCNFVGAQSEPVDDCQHLASQDPAWTLIDVRQYVDQQCGEAPAWV